MHLVVQYVSGMKKSATAIELNSRILDFGTSTSNLTIICFQSTSNCLFFYKEDINGIDSFYITDIKSDGFWRLVTVVFDSSVHKYRF